MLDVQGALAGPASPQAADWHAPVTISNVRVVPRSWRATTAADWDGFAARAGGSFLGALNVLRVRRLVSSVRLFDFELSGPARPIDPVIGRCAVIVRKNAVVFLDRLHILPEYRPLWGSCFKALVELLGAKEYTYGSLWNQEDPSPFHMEGCEIGRSPKKRFDVDIIDTNAWPDFKQYFRSASKTIRHDYQRVERLGNFEIDMRRGIRAICLIPELVRCRESVIEKHGEAFEHRTSRLFDYLSIASKIALFGDRAIIALTRGDGECKAAFFGIQFGNRLYHIIGGTKPNKEGAGSYLMLTMIRYLFEHVPRAQLVLGFTVGLTDPTERRSGNGLYRRKIRATSVRGTYETFIVRELAAAQGRM